MSIDIKRYKDWESYQSGLLSKLSPRELQELISTKFLDLYKYLTPDEVEREIKKIIVPELQSYFDVMRNEYDSLISKVNTLYSDISGDLTRDLTKIRAIEKITNTKIGLFQKQTIKKINGIITLGIIEKQSEDEVVRQLKKIGGKTADYAQAIANTQLMAYGRTAKATKAELGNVNHFDYVGTLKSNTRPFCEACLRQKSFTLEEIKNLDNGASQPKPVLYYGGGFRCIHGFEPDPFADK